jgi:histidinol-phosphate/aromatic aminotransferase/cobyric acid decarboxylase-like protein
VQKTLFENCFHGGAFFEAVGERFESLARSRAVINADVLDAWFPPAPAVLDALQGYLPWLLRTSPPTQCRGFLEAVAETRDVSLENLLPGAGSSDLIFRVLREWLTPASRVLLLDPTYGEYAHVLERVIGCQVTRFELHREQQYSVSLQRLSAALRSTWDLVILVNPNSPTGRHIPRSELEAVLREVPASTKVWLDETYVDYLGPGESLERFAAHSRQVVVCKSMSKVYALSGARVAYLCGPRDFIAPLRAITPPWVVSLPAQLAAVRALESPAYYAVSYAETHTLRQLGWEAVPGVANFLLCHLPASGPTAAEWTSACRAHGLYVRNAAAMGHRLGEHALRIAVKDEATNQRMLAILHQVQAQLCSDRPFMAAVAPAAA